MKCDEYSKREVDMIWGEIKEALTRIEAQTIRTNGRVTRLERLSLVLLTAIIMFAVTNFPEFSKLLMSFV